MNTERSLGNAGEQATDSRASRRIGTKSMLLAAAGAILLLGGCVAYEREDHYHGRKGWGPHHYNHMDGHHHRDRRYR